MPPSAVLATPEISPLSEQVDAAFEELSWRMMASVEDASQDMVSSRKRAIALDQTDRARARSSEKKVRVFISKYSC